MTKTNERGIAHFLLLAALVLGVGIFGTYKMVVNTSQVSITSSCKNKILKVGSSGTCVKQLQSELKISADGSFGPKTKAAVQSYQTGNGLVPDGIVGPNTWAKLSGQSLPKSNSQPKSASDVAKPRISCKILNPSSVRVGTQITPRIAVRNNTPAINVINISGSIGDGSKGADITGSMSAKPKGGVRIFTGNGSFTAITAGKPIQISARVSSEGSATSVCTKSIMVNRASTPRGLTAN